jgi:hypothetical protein
MMVLHPLQLTEATFASEEVSDSIRRGTFVTRLRDLSCATVARPIQSQTETWAKLQPKLGRYRYCTCGQP